MNDTTTMVPQRTNILIANNVGPKLLRALLDEIQQIRQTWKQTNQVEQQQVIDRLRSAVDQAIRNATAIIAAAGATHFAGKLDSIGVKDGLKCVLKVADTSHDVEELIKQIGGDVLLVLPDARQFTDGMETIKADPDQPELLLPEVPPADETQQVPELQGAEEDI